jgi:xanthine dehydrogenase small subunit
MRSSMRDSIFFYLNGNPVTASGDEALLTVAQFLRRSAGATGTKIVCEEGDCGSCTVLVGRPVDGRLDYLPINSCIQFVHHMDGAHVITVEGLQTGRTLHPVQEAMVRCHGAQCGYCTPGFVVAMTSLVERNAEPSEADVRDALTGNLCRCTGYTPIINAALTVKRDAFPPLSERYRAAGIATALIERTAEPFEIVGTQQRVFAPRSVEEAVAWKARHGNGVVMQGATDLGVQRNKRHHRPEAIMLLSNVDALDELDISADVVTIGANVNLTRLEEFMESRVPEFHAILKLFGAPQIKNAATLAGNIANASPIADTVPFLYVMNAEVEVIGARGIRSIPIESFYLGYKTLDLHPDEIITRVRIPLPGTELLKLYKVSRRRNLDISTVTAAFRFRMNGSTIAAASVAFGGVGPTVVRLRNVEQSLAGRELSLETMESAAAIARAEVRPLSDVRGSAEFRTELVGNLFERCFFDAQEGSRRWAS